VMPHPMFPNAPDDEHDVRAARMRKPLTSVDELAREEHVGPARSTAMS
jgi:hypothetical protein